MFDLFVKNIDFATPLKIYSVFLQIFYSVFLQIF